MIKYFIGSLKNLSNPAVSLFSKMDNVSEISRKAKINSCVQVCSSSIGDYSYVGRHSRIVHADIGKFCSIAGEVLLGMGTHTLDNLSTSPIFTEAKNGTGHTWVDLTEVKPFRKVMVGNDVWIGTRAMIMGGITIGDGAVIGAGAIVTKDVPPYAVVAGVPARVLRYRFQEDEISMIKTQPWWDMPEDFLRSNLSFFQRPLSIEDISELSRLYSEYVCGEK